MMSKTGGSTSVWESMPWDLAAMMGLMVEGVGEERSQLVLVGCAGHRGIADGAEDVVVAKPAHVGDDLFILRHAGGTKIG